MIKRKLVLSIYLLVSCLVLPGQIQHSKWYFGQYAGLDFTSNGPVPLLNSAMSAAEGCASIADAGGNLLFYTNGDEVYNSNHQVMANGTNLGGNISAAQSSLIIPDLASSSLYHIFTVWDLGGPLAHSIVDMSLAAGKGSVTIKNVILDQNVSERLHGARHCNGRDYWIVTTRDTSNEFLAFLLTPNGLQSTPVVSKTGPKLSSRFSLKISPTGNKIGVIDYLFAMLYDFDASNGQVSHPLLLNDTTVSYGGEFSPDGTKFYASDYYKNEVVQWTVCGADSVIRASYTSIFKGLTGLAMQLAPDKKIYCALGATSISVINFPNLAGTSAGYSSQTIGLGNKFSNGGLPNFIYQINRPAATIQNTIHCNTANVSYTLPVLPCASKYYQPTGIKWRFGDPMANGNDTASSQNPAYAYSKNGTYTVHLIVYYPCVNDTFKSVIAVTGLPQLAVSGRNKICEKETTILTVSGADSYTWSGGQQTASVVLNPSVTTVYTISAGKNNCQASLQHTVTVNKCLGIITRGGNTARIYPNPATDMLTVEGFENQTLKMLDLLGRTLIVLRIQRSVEHADISTLKNGVYLLQAENGAMQLIVKQ